MAFLFVILVNENVFAQYPQYFTYSDENGLPSNEVYSIITDEKGFIWLSGDAGLFKFDGVRYIAYKCTTQKSKSISGLTISSSGKLYCHNFQSQIFYLENDTLKELTNRFSKIPNIICDKSGNLFVNHLQGISVYNEQTKRWKNYPDVGEEKSRDASHFASFTRSARVNNKNEVYFIAPQGIGKINQGQLSILKNNLFDERSSETFNLECYSDEQWLFSVTTNKVYRKKRGSTSILPVENEQLSTALLNRKITSVRFLSDGNFWICTYKGIIQYNPKTEAVRIYYPDFSFSDCLIDRENNYWFSTLQAGLIRVPDLNFLVWNNQNPLLENERIVKTESDNKHIYFATVNGSIGKLNTQTNELKVFHTGKDADIQSLNYSEADQCLYFYSFGSLFALKNDKIQQIQANLPPIKSLLKVGDVYFLASSFGAYIHTFGAKAGGNERVKNWTREIATDASQKQTWVASNEGLFRLLFQSNRWQIQDTIFPNQQILSLHFDATHKQLYSLSFDGKISSVSLDGTPKLIAQLHPSIQSYKLKYYQKKIYIATNKGLWIFDLVLNQWQSLTALSGLASSNVQDLTLIDHHIWLATGKGLQKIPLNTTQIRPKAKLYLKSIGIGKLLTTNKSGLKLNYQQSLIIKPEAIAYSSNGNFQYAYRIKNSDENWSIVPASIEQITILNIPTGNFEIELKVIDHLGRDSENTINILGYVNPPFYLKWWFYVGLLLLLLLVIYNIYKYQLAKQKEKFKHQNELNIAKLTALRSQMNPHFIFNSLNAIQDLILQQKTVESYDYVVLFSDLVRNALHYSNQEFIPIHKEIEFLDTYLQLEKLRFKDEFDYFIHYDRSDEIDVPSLLIQPFAENALLHGLLHKEGKKELSVKFIFDKQQLTCIIEDNGIGRKQANAIRNRQSSNHQSFALEAIKKRLDVFNEQQGKTVGNFYFEDIYPTEKDTGTRVIIQLPFKRHY